MIAATFFSMFLCVILILPLICNIRIDHLDITGMEDDLVRWKYRSTIPKEYIQHGGNCVATVFLN